MLEGWRFKSKAEKAAKTLESLADEVSVGIQVVDIGTLVPDIMINHLAPLTGQIKKYLAGPTIVYEDVDHTQRREVKQRILKVEPSLSWFIELDRLGLNNLHDLYYALSKHTPYLGKTPELIDTVLGVTQLIPRSSSHYDQWNDQEKVGLTQEIASGLLTAHMLLKKNEASLKR